MTARKSPVPRALKCLAVIPRVRNTIRFCHQFQHLKFDMTDSLTRETTHHRERGETDRKGSEHCVQKQGVAATVRNYLYVFRPIGCFDLFKVLRGKFGIVPGLLKRMCDRMNHHNLEFCTFLGSRTSCMRSFHTATLPGSMAFPS